MTRKSWILVGIVVYLIGLWLFHRYKRIRGRRIGLSPERLAVFDHKGFVAELEEIWSSGLPEEYLADCRKARHSLSSESPLSGHIGSKPSWFCDSVWDGELPSSLPKVVIKARDRLMDGKIDDVDKLIDVAQEPVISQGFASLAVHFFIRRLYEGDLAGAEVSIKKLSLWTCDRIGETVVQKYLAQIALLRSYGDAKPKRWIKKARQHIANAGGGSRYSDSGTRALWAHISLVYVRGFFNEDFVLLWVDYSLRRSLLDNRSSSLVYYGLAHCCLYRAKHEEAAEHLARALYFGGGDHFYASPLLEWKGLDRIKPALVKQAQSAVEGSDLSSESVVN